MYRCLTGGQRVRNNDDLQLIVCLSLTPLTGPLSSLLFESMMNGPELLTQLSLHTGVCLKRGL